MDRLKQLFAGGKKTFMPYVCAGDPNADFTVKLVKTLVANGADAIELGIPFSDPIADGKTIQAASQRALEGGMTPAKAMELVARLRREGIAVPIVAMTYYNIVYANGTKEFIRQLKEAGADGLIVPDAPLEESEELHQACAEAGLDLIYLVTPNCSEERLRTIAARASGFLYAVAVFGTTGKRTEVSKEAIGLLVRLKKITSLPVAVGFGVSNAAQARAYAKAGADGIIVGSGLIDLYAKYLASGGKLETAKALEEVAAFTRGVKKAIGAIAR